jgi:hypothetical protein
LNGQKVFVTCRTEFGKKMDILGENPSNDQRVSFSRIELLMVWQFIWFARSWSQRNCGRNEWQQFYECEIRIMIAVVMIMKWWIQISIERINERKRQRLEKEEWNERETKGRGV